MNINEKRRDFIKTCSSLAIGVFIPGCSNNSNPSESTTLPVSAQPTIIKQPENRSVILGEQATFSVVVLEAPFTSYQWQRNGVNIQGATNSSYTTQPVILSDDNSLFTVTITNQSGNITSDTATLQVKGFTVTIDTTTITIDSTFLTTDII